MPFNVPVILIDSGLSSRSSARIYKCGFGADCWRIDIFLFVKNTTHCIAHVTGGTCRAAWIPCRTQPVQTSGKSSLVMEEKVAE